LSFIERPYDRKENREEPTVLEEPDFTALSCWRKFSSLGDSLKVSVKPQLVVGVSSCRRGGTAGGALFDRYLTKLLNA